MSLEEISANLRRLKDSVQSIAVEAGSAASEVIESRAKDNLYPGHGYLTGALQNSIVTELQQSSQQQVVYRVGPSSDAGPVVPGNPKPIDYALFVEFGTAKHPEIPYMRPAYDQGKEDAITAAANVVRARLAEVLR